ncbi:MAG: Na+/H+ antiporter NhaC family protein [bacterium]|nr:Na+/H+ antiporter NhaC family protein [bacterium]
MRGRFRFLLAFGFLALFALLPAPDAETGRPYLGYLQVRAWLLDADSSPLAGWLQAGKLPELRVDLRTSPPITDPQLAAERRNEFARLADEFAVVKNAAVAPELGALPLAVIIGEYGVRASAPRPDGSRWTGEQMFPTRVSLLPAALTITVALLFRRVLLALLLGGLAGAIAYTGGAGSGTWHFFASALVERSLLSNFYLRITAFVVFLFMTVGLVTKNGGVHGFVAWLQRRVRGPVGAQFATWLTGLSIFFDDYTNCMVTGTAMRPLCDAEKISREKLAYIVDSTAAPVAGVSLFSTWITYEISQFRGPLALVTDFDGQPFVADDAYGVFVATLPFRFYCFLALILVPLVILTRRDFGPMLAAERQARAGLTDPDAGQPGLVRDARNETPAPDVPRRARNAILPIGVLVGGAATAMLAFDIVSDVALFGASITAWLLAIVLSLGQRLMSPGDIARTSLAATRALIPAFGILFLAWSLGHISADLGTRDFLAAGARDVIAPWLLPIALFLLSAIIAFATGTSFGTMAILLPNVVLLAHQLGTDAAFLGDAMTGGPWLMLLSIGAVLEGAIFGDHCSPISDTTVLSSLGSRCDHLAHVTTQLPYALLTASVAIGAGYLPMVTLGPSWWPLSYALAIVAFVAVLRFVGRDANAEAAAMPTSSS